MTENDRADELADHEPVAGDSPVGLWQAADLVTPMSIRVAATLRLADPIAAGTVTAAALAELVDADPDALSRLLAHLATAGVLDRTSDGGYALTELGAQLTDSHPGGGRAWIDSRGAVGRPDLALVELERTVRTGEPAYPRVYGRGFWDDLGADEALSASFDRLMGARGGKDEVVAAYDWSAARHVVGVGGGDGTLLAAVLEANAELEGTIVELDGPAAAARRTFADAGLANRAHVAVGSFFGPLPTGGDHYVLSAVIHDWDDQRARQILDRCAAAAGAAGTVLLVEGLRAGGDGDEISTEMDLRMLAYFSGRERTLDELTALADDAGLDVIAVHPVDGYRSIVQLAPRGQALG